MAEIRKKLTEAMVRQRLASYNDSKVTDEKSKVDEAVDRFKTLDTKATHIFSYYNGQHPVAPAQKLDVGS